jgi:regulator of cell morphogenesis and NO signaling
MTITADTRISDIATTLPATIKVFQQHQIDFCCGGRIPLSEACARQGLDQDELLAELQLAQSGQQTAADWSTESLSSLIGHIQQRYHEPLRSELARLRAMLDKVVQRHGDRMPETLLPLRDTFDRFHHDLLSHMAKEDAVLFPAIRELEAGVNRNPAAGAWIEQPMAVMVDEHESAGEALATMRALTNGYAPPEDACPTFRGLYFGLSELEREMHVHVHLENNILFPRATQLSNSPSTRTT